ncbi:MAG: hypothetical protein IPJ98_31065 [Bryobacterales bacterium]|nr:hypothetical protein [Bryobacterales bacterium]
MFRFNLIFHGMMLFEERKATNDFRVIIPHIGTGATSEHMMLYGNPAAVQGNPVAGLSPLTPGQEYKVIGPKSGSRKLLELLSPYQNLILDGSKVKVGAIDDAKDVVITVPKPTAIRRFRCLEVFDQNILGQTPPALIRGGAKPAELLDAYCFVYQEFESISPLVKFGDDSEVVLMRNMPFNLCVYAQRACDKVEEPNHAEGEKAYHRHYQSTTPHETAINRLLTVKSGSATFDLQLSMLGKAEPAYNPGGTSGIAKIHLMNLPELLDCPNVTDPTGCSGAMLDENG